MRRALYVGKPFHNNQRRKITITFPAYRTTLAFGIGDEGFFQTTLLVYLLLVVVKLTLITSNDEISIGHTILHYQTWKILTHLISFCLGITILASILHRDVSF